MHILLVNDDGPPSKKASPYVHSLARALQAAGHTVSVVLPHVQRSWIGKSHMVGQTLTATYFRPGTVHQDDGIISPRPFNDGKEEWILIDGTPASCTQIGLYHFFKDRGPIDLVLSGPNFGRNTTALFALSSGTIGAAMEGAVCGKKSIALSYAFNAKDMHNVDMIESAARMSVRLVEKFVKEWPEDVDLFNINVPLQENAESAKVVYCDVLQNQWKRGSSYQKLIVEQEDGSPAEEEKEIREGLESNGDATEPAPMRPQVKFKWAPNFVDVMESIEGAHSGDGWAVLQGHVSVTPLRANFWHAPGFNGEIKLAEAIGVPNPSSKPLVPAFRAVVEYPDQYVQPLILRALKNMERLPTEVITSLTQLGSSSTPVLQVASYESIDFEHAQEHPTTSLACAYVIRKALIRKHYLSNTVSTWLVKHPESILRQHFKSCVHFELDYAEFLDDALVDAWDLNESMQRNEQIQDIARTEWWILKPGMSDGGNGIRLFSSLDQLRAIFEGWDEDECQDEQEGEDESNESEFPAESKDDDDNQVGDRSTASDAVRSGEFGAGTMTSQLRHFIAQPYIDPPLLLKSPGGRKFHIRTYVLAVGALRVYVYREMLALFAAKPYESPISGEDPALLDLAHHLTNTCFQTESTRQTSVYRFWGLDSDFPAVGWQDSVFAQICSITGEVFEAAAREQIVHFQAIPNAFEVFGVDFLVDAELNVWLLEPNAYPDFKQTGQDLQDVVVGDLWEDVVETAVRPFFDPDCGREGTERMRLVRNVDLGRR